MELSQLGLLEELLLAQKGENSWTNFPSGLLNEIAPDSLTFDQDLNSNSSLMGLISSPEPNYAFPYPLPFTYIQDSTGPEIGSIQNNGFDLEPIPFQEDFKGIREDVRMSLLGNEQICERVEACAAAGESKSKTKKVGARPSKNLMAERRRRKRLNDRLSMLRSIVPKISKMDRTAILGDTIDYMKELVDKIRKLREDKIEENMNEKDMAFGSNFDEPIMTNESLVRNTPKLDVESRNGATQVELRCGAKPGLLLSTLGTLEAFGVDVQQCVISCFNDFSLQASCSEVVEHRRDFSSEDIKLALSRNAGYEGRCL